MAGQPVAPGQVRSVRHWGARKVDMDKSLPLSIIPYFISETPLLIRGTLLASSRWEFSCDRIAEVNWHIISVPWNIILMMNTAGNLYDYSSVSSLDEATEWDTIYRSMVYEYGTSGAEFYGGSPTQGDDVDALGAIGEGSSSAEGSDEGLLSVQSRIGPMGVVVAYTRETLLTPKPIHDERGDNNSVSQWTDRVSFNIRLPAMSTSGGCIFIGCTRFKDSATLTNFGVQMEAPEHNQMGALIAGDYTRVQSTIMNNQGTEGDYVRTLLFGGESYIEGGLTPGDQDLYASAKTITRIASPYVYV